MLGRDGSVSFWADSAFIAAAGTPTVLFGPGGAGAHAVEEWVSLADTESSRARWSGSRSGCARSRQPGARPVRGRAARRGGARVPRVAAGLRARRRCGRCRGSRTSSGSARSRSRTSPTGSACPAFKVLGASWAVERALRERPDVHTLVAASAGNHGRAVAHVAALRGLAARILLPARSAPARRAAIAAEGAELVVVDGDYEDAVRQAAEEGASDGCLEVADVGDSGPAHWVDRRLRDAVRGARRGASTSCSSRSASARSRRPRRGTARRRAPP